MGNRAIKKKHITILSIFSLPYFYGVYPAAIDTSLKSRVSWFTATQYASIYNFPSPPNTPKTIGVISFGGGIFGSINSSGVLTSGDVQTYWTSLGITSQPKVIVVLVDGATNSPNASDGATIENTIDIEMIGACCPTSNLTIILYIAPNSFAEFVNVFNRAINVPVVVDGTSYTPNVISISWGAPELYYPRTLLNTINSLFASAVAAGINITAASGDNGSSDGVAGGPHVDFPASSPNVVACGGTHLSCPNLIYDGSTTEVAWSSGGGAVSAFFAKPTYQSAISATGRAVPDIAMDADPATGVVYRIGGSLYVIGGTSIVSPAMAAYLLCIGVTGLANTKLYTAARTSGRFHDITSGNNGDFSAGIGYDKVTGLGSLVGNTLASAMIDTSGIAVSNISLNTSTISIIISRTYQLTATVTPGDATNQTVSWLSSSPDNASVSSNGLVTGIANGSAIITARTNDGGFVASASVTVNTTAVLVSNISLSPSSATIVPTGIQTFTATVTPTGATNKIVVWSSSAPSVAIVNSSGVVTGVANGTTIIRATATDGSNRNSSVTVIVSTRVTGISLSPPTVTIGVGESIPIIPTVLPTEVTNKTLRWKSNNVNIARISNGGTVIGIGPGNTTITATTVDGGFTATTAITVVRRVTSVAIAPANAFVRIGSTIRLTPTILPINSTIRTITWSTSNAGIATISGGIVRGIARGTVIITATVDGRSKTSRIIVS